MNVYDKNVDLNSYQIAQTKTKFFDNVKTFKCKMFDCITINVLFTYNNDHDLR